MSLHQRVIRWAVRMQGPLRRIDAPSGADRLEKLDLTSTELHTLDFLAELPALKRLFLGGSGIRDLSPVSLLVSVQPRPS